MCEFSDLSQLFGAQVIFYVKKKLMSCTVNRFLKMKGCMTIKDCPGHKAQMFSEQNSKNRMKIG